MPSAKSIFRTLSVCVALLTAMQLHAQDPLTSHTRSNHLLFNPSYSGALDHTQLAFGGQNVIQSFDSLEQYSYTGTFQTGLGDGRHGLGAAVLFINQPLFGQIASMELNYSFRIINEEQHTLALGVGAGASWIQVITNPDGNVLPGVQDRPSKWYGDYSAGIWYAKGDFFSGLGAKHLSRPKLAFSQSITAQIRQLYTLLLGYDVQAGDPVVITPSMTMRLQNNDDVFTDFMLSGNYGREIGLGIGYRVDLGKRELANPASGATDRLRIQQLLLNVGVGLYENYHLDIGYQYLLSTGPFYARNRSSLEVTFKADFD